MNDHKAYERSVIKTYAADQIVRDFPNWLRDTAKYLSYQWLGPVTRRVIIAPPTRFLVICHSRTGSNFLLWLLGSHPLILHVGEPFGAYNLECEWIRRRVLQFGAVPYLEEQLLRKGHEAAVGFKFLYQQLEASFAEQWSISDMSELIPFMCTGYVPKVIHLKRRDRLANLVSHRIAEITKTYVLFNPNKRSNHIEITLTPEECEADFAQVAAWEQRYDGLFAQHALLPVYYEDLHADTQNQGQHILDFLEVKQHRLQEQTLKQNVRPIREVVTNYEALKQHFAGTIWASVFDA